MQHQFAVTSIAFVAAVVSAVAGISAPIPFAKLSAEESRILVVRDGGDGFCESQLRFPTLSSGESIDFLEQFPRSGVYTLPERQLIYAIEWFCLERELLASPDLRYLARMNRFGGDWALKFYADGIETKTFTIDQLLTGFRGEAFRPLSTWDYYHSWCGAFEVSGQEVVLATVGRQIRDVPIGYCETYRFDFATGNLLDTDVQAGGPVVALAVLTGIVAVLAWRVAKGFRATRVGTKPKSE